MATAAQTPTAYPGPEAHEHFVTIPTRVWKIGFVAGAVVSTALLETYTGLLCIWGAVGAGWIVHRWREDGRPVR
jgi:hypothetical protein